MNNIIAIAGRKSSGKSLLSNQLISQGYVKISFADYLKQSVSKLYNLDIKSLQDPVLKEKDFDVPLIWNLDKLKEYSDMVEADLSKTITTTTMLFNPRQLLQFIGTEILKTYDKLFHVKKTISSLSSELNYICDDLRFIEEKECFENLKSHNFNSVFIIKPDNWKISNHPSETSLLWSMFKNIIVNDDSIDNLINNFKNLNNLNYSLTKNYSFLNIDKSNAYWAGIIYGAGKFIDQQKYEIIIESDNFYKLYYLVNFINSNRESSNAELAAVTKTENKKHFVRIQSPFIIENLKLWSINNQEYIPKDILKLFEEGYQAGKGL